MHVLPFGEFVLVESLVCSEQRLSSAVRRSEQLQRKIASSFITVSTVALPVVGQQTLVRPEVLQQYGLDQQTVSGRGGPVGGGSEWAEWAEWASGWAEWGQ